MNPANPFDQGTQAPLSLLQDFAQNADLRARLEADPVGTFAEFGIQIQAETAVDISSLAGNNGSKPNPFGPPTQDKWAGIL